MAPLLEKALAEVALLPTQEQDVIGAWLISEIGSDRRWDDLFARSLPMLEKMADEALQDHERGLTAPLDPDQM
ncbi:MAG: hypothetical protein NTZ56_05915 [Acidobacteria bacterium]|nr:hypothetical protein [Acidobacteriota bacterium]